MNVYLRRSSRISSAGYDHRLYVIELFCAVWTCHGIWLSRLRKRLWSVRESLDPQLCRCFPRWGSSLAGLTNTAVFPTVLEGWTLQNTATSLGTSCICHCERWRIEPCVAMATMAHVSQWEREKFPPPPNTANMLKLFRSAGFQPHKTRETASVARPETVCGRVWHRFQKSHWKMILLLSNVVLFSSINI